jgi:hypothetical protein
VVVVLIILLLVGVFGGGHLGITGLLQLRRQASAWCC